MNRIAHTTQRITESFLNGGDSNGTAAEPTASTGKGQKDDEGGVGRKVVGDTAGSFKTTRVTAFAPFLSLFDYVDLEPPKKQKHGERRFLSLARAAVISSALPPLPTHKKEAMPKRQRSVSETASAHSFEETARRRRRCRQQNQEATYR